MANGTKRVVRPGSTAPVSSFTLPAGTVYAPGEVVTNASVEAIVEGYRNLYDTRLAELTGPEIWAVLQAIPGRGDDAESARMNALEAAINSKVEKEMAEVTAPRSAVEVDADAKAVADAFDDKMRADLAVVSEATFAVRGGPIVTAGNIRRLVKAGTMKDPVEWPVIGSRYDRAPYNIPAGQPGHTNARPDHYDANPKIEGSKKGSWSQDVWDQTRDGVINREMKELVKLVADNLSAVSQDDVKRVNQYIAKTGLTVSDINKSENAYNNAVSEIDTIRTSQIAAFRKGARFEQRRAEIGYFLPKVGIKELASDMATLARLRKPVALIDREKDSKTEGEVGKALSLTDFIRMDFAKALEHRQETFPGSQIGDISSGDLRATVGRRKKPDDTTTAQGGGEDKSGVRQVMFTTVEQVEAGTSAMMNYFDSSHDLYAKRMADLTANLAAKDGAERVKQFGDLIANLNEFFAPFQDVYDSLQKAKQANVMAQLKKSIAASK